MNSNKDHVNPITERIGNQVGHEAVGNSVQRAEDYCECERQRIEVSNQPKILSLRAEMSILLEKEKDLKDRRRHAPPPGSLQARRRKSRFYWAVAIILAVAGFFFSLLAVDPYGFGWKGYLYCLGIAIIAPCATEQFLEKWGSPRIMKTLTGVAFLAALTSLVLLALIRGDILARSVENAFPVVVFGGDTLAPVATQNDFYGATLPRFKFLMALMTLALDIGAGLALYEARRLGDDSGEDPQKIEQELAAVQQQMVLLVYQITTLQNEAAVFVSQFWRDFYRAMLSGTVRSAITRFSAVLLCAILLGTGTALAAERMHVVVAVDLSQSVAVKDGDQVKEFDKNLAGVGRLLSGMPAGSRATILGITDNSFGQPAILLEASVDGDEGYFKERLATARRQIAQAWKKQATRLGPHFPHTDILGALLVAGELFRQRPASRKVLVIFSDMRHETAALDLERAGVVSVASTLESTEQQRLIADLHGVEVCVLGVHSAGRTYAYWSSLREFWSAYFKRAGASVKAYTVLRDLPGGVLD
jgi:hypothetical protein